MGSPPPTHPQRKQRRHLIPQALVAAVAVILFIQFTILPRFLSSAPSPASVKLSTFHQKRLDDGLAKCIQLATPPVEYAFPVAATRANPRWNPTSGQNQTVILRNATLFDGESSTANVDIVFEKGVVTSVSASASGSDALSESRRKSVLEIDLAGAFVTPGLVDMHSHHMVSSWPGLEASGDGNEVHPDSGPLTPFVRAKDSIKTGDMATAIIASGGITASLVLPGSANVMGGEGIMVKNYVSLGEEEEVVERYLLEDGVEESERRRYLKMACGENPARVYGHTRMGNAWVFRHHMERARELVLKQDEWCLSAAAAKSAGDAASISALVKEKGGLPEELELDSSVAMLRGKIGINIHCYEPEDFEDMLSHSKEFGFKIQAFHHALSAWKVPEMIKAGGDNITVATFSSFGFYKKEAYDTNVWAGKILADHGVPVAYKSDHGSEELNAKYLLFQAATAHSFHLKRDLALQSVTSVPAKSLGLDHRIGYVRPGYDADLVIWDSDPLSVGATPLQVYIDGKITLDPEIVKDSLSRVAPASQKPATAPKMRAVLEPAAREEVCRQVKNGKTVIKGITTSYLKNPAHETSEGGELTLVLDNGKVTCFGACVKESSGSSNTITLQDGHVLPGLTAASSSLGMAEITMEETAGDGTALLTLDPLNPDNLVYAKYGVHLEGKNFKRARMGGVTRAITEPMGDGFEGGFVGGVSVGIKTSGGIEGGVWKDDVALYFTIAQASKATPATRTISIAIAKLRKILTDNASKDNIYGRAANGTIPLVVRAENKYDILQLISVKKDFPTTNLVILGASDAPAVASQLAASKIPVLLTGTRPAPESWEKKDVLTGPPLTRAPASVLADAGVKFGIALLHAVPEGDSVIFGLLHEASWAAKYAGLSAAAAVDLVSRNVEAILDLGVKEEERDWVVYEGNPLQFGGSVVLVVQNEGENGKGKVVECWPTSE